MEHHNDNFWNQIKTLIYGVFLYLKIETEPVTILSILMVCDTFLGIIKILIIKPSTFSIKALFLGYLSKLAFLILPISIALIGKGINYNLVVFVEISLKILIISEGISIISNLISIKTKEEIKNYDIITGFLKQIREVLIKIGMHFTKNKN